MPAAAQVTAYLDGLLAELVARSAGRAPRSDVLPIPVIDDPATARHMLMHPEVFEKNYAFLDALARARLSSNGADWRQRRALTQTAYAQAPIAQNAQAVLSVYARHLAAGEVLDADKLTARFTSAAVEVFSAALGLAAPIPWPEDTMRRVRETLKLRQWIDWNGCAAEDLVAVDEALQDQRSALSAQWQGRADTGELLARWRAAGRDIVEFDAAEELLQGLLAATETTASTLLWAVDLLSTRPELQERLAAQPQHIDRCIDEVLRLFPPVPFLTRRCVAAHEFKARRWAAGELTSISIVGLHRHPAHWQRPQQFDPARAEFDVSPPPLAYLPFSRGERVCAGMRLARIELRAGLEAFLGLRRGLPGPVATQFDYGLVSRPRTSLSAPRH
jgi:cytochrome P450